MHWRISLALTGISAASADAEIDRALQEAASAIELMRTAYGSNLQCSRFLGWTASACLDHGRLELARRLLDEAVQVTAGEGERYWVSELHRLRARLLRAEGAPDDEIARAFDAALDVARTQGAKTFEQRALDDQADAWPRDPTPSSAAPAAPTPTPPRASPPPRPAAAPSA